MNDLYDNPFIKSNENNAEDLQKGEDMPKQFNLFIPITKVDEEKRLVFGLATAEEVDKSGEIFDYFSSLPYYKEWSGEIHKVSGGKSFGNVREMHTNIAAGKLTQINFDDANKRIEICAKIVDDQSWAKVLEGVLTGFSHGGEYIKTWKDPANSKLTRYTARPAEISVVDNPCLGSATFELLRADGATEMRKFKTKESPVTEPVIDGKLAKPKYVPVQKWEASDGKTFAKKEDWRLHELSLEAAKGSKPTHAALAALDELNKTITAREGVKEDPKPDDQKTDEEKALEKVTAAKEVLDRKEALVVKIKEVGEQLKKGYSEAYDSKRAIEAICIIEELMSGEEWEAMMGEAGEDSQIADLKEAINRLKSFVASEIQEDTDGDEMAMAMSADILKKYVSEEVANKILVDVKESQLGKAGARHSGEDKVQLGKAKDAVDSASDHLDDAKKAHTKVGDAHGGMREAVDALGKCMKGILTGNLAKEAEDATKTSASEHLAKLDDHLDKADKHHAKAGKAHDAIAADHDVAKHALKAVGAEGDSDEAEKTVTASMKKFTDENVVLKEENAALKTEVTTLTETLGKVTAELPTLSRRIKDLEAQPLPGKGALFDAGKVGPVVKGHEAQTNPDKPVETISSSYMNTASPEQKLAFFNR